MSLKNGNKLTGIKCDAEPVQDVSNICCAQVIERRVQELFKDQLVKFLLSNFEQFCEVNFLSQLDDECNDEPSEKSELEPWFDVAASNDEDEAHNQDDIQDCVQEAQKGNEQQIKESHLEPPTVLFP